MENLNSSLYANLLAFLQFYQLKTLKAVSIGVKSLGLSLVTSTYQDFIKII